MVGEGKANVKHTEKFPANSKLKQEPVEAEKQNATIVGNSQGTTKGGKHAGKLARKKHVLNWRVETNNEPLQCGDQGENNDKRYPVKMASKSNLN